MAGNTSSWRQASLFPLVDLAKQQRENALRQAGLVADQLRQLVMARLFNATSRDLGAQISGGLLASLEHLVSMRCNAAGLLLLKDFEAMYSTCS